jgi:hypothetical protein
VETPGKPNTNQLAFVVGYKQPIIAHVEDINSPSDEFNSFVIGSRATEDLILSFITNATNSTYYPEDVTKVYWNNQQVPIEYMASGNPTNSMRVRVPNRYLWQAGNIELKVVNPEPGGGVMIRTVQGLYPQPLFNTDPGQGLSPQRGRSIGAQGILLRIKGQNFIKDVSQVILMPDGIWNENNAVLLPTQYVSSTDLIAQKSPPSLCKPLGVCSSIYATHPLQDTNTQATRRSSWF